MSQKSINFANVIKLNKHIETLLLNNECVIIPGFGGFMAYHVEAKYDSRDCTFLPPMRTLGFNHQLKLNDSLMAQSYVETYDISYPEALRCIENEVEEIKQHLQNTGQYQLEDIGLLSYNEDGNIEFEPCESGILTPNLYGLSSFEFSLQDQTDQLSISCTETKNQSNYVDEVVEDDENIIKIKVSWIRNIAAVAAAIIAFFLINTPISNSNNDNVTLSNIGGNLFTHTVTKTTIDISKTDIREAIKKEVTLNTPETTEQIPVSTGGKQEIASNEFCIIMASHITKRNANNFVEELHKKGYSEAYTYINNGIVRVAFGKYKSLEDANKVLKEIRQNKNYKQSWVLKKR